jgi:hypothetical protein
MKAIVAGIINMTTGEISDTTTETSQKVKLSLKVRDELNKEYGADAFMSFAFNGLSDVSYVKSKMKSKDPAVKAELQMLQCQYELSMIENKITRIEEEIAFISQISDDCAKHFTGNECSKNNFLQELIEDRDSEAETKLKIAKLTKRQHLKSIETYRAMIPNLCK